MQKIDINCSIIIPLYNEENNIEILYNTLTDILKNLVSEYEIIFVDDGSKDMSFEVVRLIKITDSQVRGISLSRNYGHQIALAAGIDAAKGDIVITMDGDMQHPPELIKTLIDKYTEGFDIVNTRRLESMGISFSKKITSVIFYNILNKLSDFRIEPASADFRLMNRKATDAIKRLKEKDRFTRGLVSWIGFKQTIIDYKAPERLSGETKYTIRKMIRLGLNGLTSFSSKPLRLSLYSGLIIFVIGVAYAIYAIYQHVYGNTVPGWTSLLISVLIIGSIQLLSLGILGEYLAIIFNEAKARPLYLVKDEI
jgi:polyisoprenyl-phosphate glycosyltransferase